MKENSSIWRITAFWALCESGLGGILHALQLPFKGGILCFLALLCIALIVRQAKNPFQEVMSAMAIVILIKGIISPHSPITAYVAVAFQGVVGGFLMSLSPKSFWIFPAVFICYLETALQKLFTLWLYFGNSFWKALSDFGDWINSFLHIGVSNFWLPVGIYLGVYLILAIIAAILLPQIISGVYKMRHDVKSSNWRPKSVQWDKDRHRKRKGFLFIVFMIFILTSYFSLKEGWGSGLYILIRSLAVIYLWFVYVGPWLAKQFVKYVHKRNTDLSERIQESIDFFPRMNGILQYEWNKKNQGELTWTQFLTSTLAYIIWYED